MRLENKKIVITGASSGIGNEVLKILLKDGNKVVACARHIESIDIDNPNLYLTKCDVSKKEEIDNLFNFAIEKMGDIDLFISNAGFAYYELIVKEDWDHIESIFNTNVTSAIYAAEKMKSLKGDNPYNYVVTASAMGLLSLPGYSLYSSTKAALRGFADSYRYELNKNQHFEVVYPVATKTKFFKNAGNNTPVPWPTQEASTVAKRIVNGIKHDKKHIHPSKMFYITNLLNRIFPFLLPIYVSINNKTFKKWLGSDDEY